MRILSVPWLDVNAAWILLVGGLLLIYWELCRPGTVFPGAIGGVCLLTAIARFASEPARPAALILFGAAWVAIGAEAWWRWPGPPGLAGAVVLTSAAMAGTIRWFVAAPFSLVLSFATVVLGSAAIRAFLAKRI
jgi:membrane-bound serine protease (ClpP class)